MTVGQMPPPVNNPLAAACYYDQPDIVKALLASGADPLGDAWEGGGDILRARGPLDDDPPSVRIFLASSSNARIEE